MSGTGPTSSPPPAPDLRGVCLDLSGIHIRLSGLTAALDTRLRNDWSNFLATDFGATGTTPLLDLQVSFYDGHYDADADYLPKSMQSSLTTEHARFSMPEGHATVDPSGRADVRLLNGTGDRSYFTMLNMLRACLAWLLPNRGAALIHAAGLVLDGRGFLLVGAEGAGKSTWARLGEQAGGRVVSDDLVLVDGVGTRMELLGTPFRSTHVATYDHGRWPIAGIAFSRHGTPPELNPVPGILSKARIIANLPFIADAIETDPRINALLTRIVDEVPCAELTFALDPGFVEVLRAWPEP